MKKSILPLLLFFMLLGLAGCRAKNNAPPETKEKQEMNVVRNSFQEFFKSNKRGRVANFEALAKFVDNDERPIIDKVKNGDIVVIWNLTEADFKAAQPPMIVAFGKDAATTGGPVVFSDYEVKILTADEFNSAPKAKSK